MVLSAGFGTRLRPLTDELPKPLVPVGDRPLLLAIVEALLELGAANVVVNVHYRPKEIISSLSGFGDKVQVLEEHSILGTAGGIHNARSRFATFPLVVVNGDIRGELPLDSLLQAPPSALVLGVSPSASVGTVGIGAEGTVVRLRGQVTGHEVRSADYRGMARLSRDLVHSLPSEGCLIGDVALPRLAAGEEVRVADLAASFLDVGSLGAYHEANRAWLRETLGEGASFVGQGAEVAAGIELRRSIVGQGARLIGQGVIEDCVIWPGAIASAPLSSTIVTASGRKVREGET
jgi:mannose-1-phosphate guanylyltransferase